jgi:hypothetical protein
VINQELPDSSVEAFCYVKIHTVRGMVRKSPRKKSNAFKVRRINLTQLEGASDEDAIVGQHIEKPKSRAPAPISGRFRSAEWNFFRTFDGGFSRYFIA